MATVGEALTQAAQCQAEGSAAEAEMLYRAILDQFPDLPEALNGLGIALFGQGERAAGAALVQAATAKSPSEPVFHSNAVEMLVALNRPLEAASHLERIIALLPEPAPDLIGRLGQLLLGDPTRTDEAIAILERALALGCDDVYLFAELAGVYSEAGRFEESIATYRKGLARHPDAAWMFSNMLVTIMMVSTYSARQVFEAHLEFGEAYEPLFRGRIKPHRNSPDPNRVLRIGYLSPNFRGHILMMNILPVLREHDRSKVSVHVFAHVPEPDSVTRKVMEACDDFVFIHKMDDDAVADLVREREIDILVHPMGHWADNRLLVFARKPAPIQVNYTCNSPTMGMRSFDYMFVDRWLDFDDSLQEFAVETLYRLEHGFVTTEYAIAPRIAPPPCLENGHVTFGSFNNPAKLSDKTLTLWTRVMAMVPNARLLIKGGKIDTPGFADHLRARVARFGIDPSRLSLLGHMGSYEDHLLAHNQVDIFLDSLPFGGGRTTEDAIWMGCPVVTLVGPELHGRNTANRHLRLGTPELCAHGEDDYVAICAALAADPERLSFYRANLRDIWLRSSLTDYRTHADDLERAYRDIWQLWCAEQRP
ncbi:hypothetical protein A6A04_12075 [Paramagnetospirillum marisnigri]|uniref:protein O-GlcNAc transferase n=1 Tax=Paramagnetospirillum marisnigri TaxID=1285242 RepID=A0A178MVU1_9PROT|nr:tetratricopeptide repeat protein [Paramagnetospirillum marisnigri]OAN54655.1 hypothetical protein A6A04_12075 [Paramagnetospirillum marisnigri]